MKIRRFRESIDDKFDQDMDDILMKLRFIDSNFDNMCLDKDFIKSDKDFKYISISQNNIDGVHKGTYFMCNYINSELYYKTSTFESFSSFANFYYDVMKVLELYTDDYVINNIDSMDNEFQFHIYSKELIQNND